MDTLQAMFSILRIDQGKRAKSGKSWFVHMDSWWAHYSSPHAAIVKRQGAFLPGQHWVQGGCAVLALELQHAPSSARNRPVVKQPFPAERSWIDI
eukprot:2973825-Amphidinium_carterae.1